MFNKSISEDGCRNTWRLRCQSGGLVPHFPPSFTSPHSVHLPQFTSTLLIHLGSPHSSPHPPHPAWLPGGYWRRIPWAPVGRCLAPPHATVQCEVECGVCTAHYSSCSSYTPLLLLPPPRSILARRSSGARVNAPDTCTPPSPPNSSSSRCTLHFTEQIVTKVL